MKISALWFVQHYIPACFEALLAHCKDCITHPSTFSFLCNFYFHFFLHLSLHAGSANHSKGAVDQSSLSPKLLLHVVLQEKRWYKPSLSMIPEPLPEELLTLGSWTLCGHKNLSKCLFTGKIVEGIQGCFLIIERLNKDIATKY